MIEIGSFNELLIEATRAGLLLQNFHQSPDGRWLAVWRRGSGPGATHYPSATHERPFDAMLKAFIMAFAATQIEKTADALLEHAVEDDLFA